MGGRLQDRETREPPPSVAAMPRASPARVRKALVQEQEPWACQPPPGAARGPSRKSGQGTRGGHTRTPPEMTSRVTPPGGVIPLPSLDSDGAEEGTQAEIRAERGTSTTATSARRLERISSQDGARSHKTRTGPSRTGFYRQGCRQVC